MQALKTLLTALEKVLNLEELSNYVVITEKIAKKFQGRVLI